jgi:nucleoside-diphosphate-sugar epimerase
MIYGTSRDRNVSRLLRWLRKWRVMGLPAGGRALQQPVHVEDVASALVTCLLTDATAGRTYNISGREPISFREMVAEAARAVGVRPLLVPIPLAPVAAAVGVAERLRIPVRLRAEQLHRIAEDKAFPHDDAARDFGFSPRSFAEGVQQEAESLGLAASSAAAPTQSGVR